MSYNQQEKISSEIRNQLRSALAFHRGGQLEDAVAIYQNVIQSWPESPETLASLGAALIGLNRSKEAIIHLERAITLRPYHADTCFALAEAYRSEGLIENAFEAAKVGLQGNPNYLQGRVAMADTLLDMGRHDEARVAFEAIRSTNPKESRVHGKLGCFHFHVGEMEEAESLLCSAAQALPNDIDVHWHLAALYLGQRRWVDGWPLYSWRWPIAKRVDPGTLVDIPPWQGAPSETDRLLIWGEQGLGDELMFSTCFPDVFKRIKPKNCFLTCDNRLANVFLRSFPGLEVIMINRLADFQTEVRIPECDVQISSGDLPGLFRSRTQDFPKTLSSYKVDPRAKELWAQRLAKLGDGLKVGIAWRGGSLERFKRSKSSEIGDWLEVFKTSGAQFINLQYGDCTEELRGTPLYNFDDLDPISDPDSQMALIRNLNLVIQTSNASAHMAGLLNIPTWTVLPAIADWRWSFAGEECLWYPSMRLFRQSEPGDWREVLGRVALELRNFIARQNDRARHQR